MSDADNSTKTDAAIQGEEGKRFRILVCLDGSDECYNTIRYAAKLGRGVDADIVLLYVRPVDKGMSSGGLQMRVARENMLNWGMELPGIKYLKKGRDLLVELGQMSENWEETSVHTDVAGDPLGDNKVEYTNKEGKKIVLKLKVASDIASGILEQWEIGRYDLIMVGASSSQRGIAKKLLDPAVAGKVAANAPCSVLVARGLESGHGHLICTDGTPRSLEVVVKDAQLAARCECPISLISVAADNESLPVAEKAISDARGLLAVRGIDVVEAITQVGNPVDEVIEAGADYSLIAVSDTGKTGLQRLFVGSVAFKIMQTARNSVLVVR